MCARWWPAAALLLAAAASAGAPPTPASAAAAQATALGNALCQGITPYYWEIGDKTGTLLAASQGVDSQGTPVLGSTMMGIASSAKWLYGIYIAQVRGGAANLTSQDINFLHMTSGYTNIGGTGTPESTCPPADSPDTVNTCLKLISPVDDLPYDYQDPASIGFFDYDGGHIENHASLYGGLGNVALVALGTTVSGQMGPGVKFIYTQALLPGSVYTSSSEYALVLSHVVGGTLHMYGALGRFPVCTRASATCEALNSPIPEAWHYSVAHWVEDDPATNGDGAFSAPGGQGFYPWIDSSKTYYGIIGRAVTGPEKQGFESVQCGRLIRRAWITGVRQNGRIPTAP